MKQETIKPVTGYIWVGRYRNGNLGYILPQYMTQNRAEPLSTLQRQIICDVDKGKLYYKSDFYKVKITLTPVRAKTGNYIVRRIRANG